MITKRRRKTATMNPINKVQQSFNSFNKLHLSPCVRIFICTFLVKKLVAANSPPFFSKYKMCTVLPSSGIPTTASRDAAPIVVTIICRASLLYPFY